MSYAKHRNDSDKERQVDRILVLPYRDSQNYGFFWETFGSHPVHAGRGAALFWLGLVKPCPWPPLNPDALKDTLTVRFEERDPSVSLHRHSHRALAALFQLFELSSSAQLSRSIIIYTRGSSSVSILPSFISLYCAQPRSTCETFS